jgi:para-nitrobenzyl esterase
MANTHENPVVRTIAGDVRGVRENGVAVFRGVPYAAAPTGGLRFKRPQPVPPWPGIRDATVDGPIAPQTPSRLAHVMGDFDRPQSEDCLTLNIWTQGLGKDPGLRPVMIWIHGGAFSSGAGSLPWYSGERFAADHGIVAVSINYRLGALGFLCMPGLGDGNLGFLDQVAALRWVQENIAAFGGDPATVTLVGQSAGGGSIAAHSVAPVSRGLFRRAVMQSTPFGRASRSLAEARRIGARFLDVLGLQPGETDRLASLPAARLLEATGALARLEKKFADASAPFSLVVDGDIIPTDLTPAAVGRSMAAVDLMIGTTREEMTAFFAVDGDVQGADAGAVAGVFEALFKSDSRAYYDEFRQRRASDASAAILGDLMSDHTFRIGSLQTAVHREQSGRPAYVYQFDWQSPAGLQACHCLDIPFVFDNFARWEGSPMLQGSDPVENSCLARAMHGAWAAFIRTGNPNHSGLPTWPPYRQADRMTMRFDSVIEPVSDLAGLKWRKAWPAL